MAYHQRTGEILVGMGFTPEDFSVVATGQTTTEITAWFSGLPQPTETEVLNAFNANPNAFAEMIAAKSAAIVGRVTAVRKASVQSTTGVAFTNATGLSFPLLPNSHYIFTFDGAYTTAAATTGLQLAINGPATPTTFVCGIEIAESATAWRQFAVSAYDTGGNSTGSAGSTALPFHVFGNISTGAAGGTLQLRFRSEVNASQVTIAAGSYGQLSAVGA